MSRRRTFQGANMQYAFVVVGLWVVLLCVPGAGAQDPEAAFFPLDEGNRWTYIQLLDPPGAPLDTLWRGTYAASQVVVRDTLYHVVPHPFALADTLRQDEAGRIQARVRGREQLLFDFALPDGAVYVLEPGNDTGLAYQVTARREDTVEVSAGRFEHAVTLRFDDPDVIDEERAFTFVRGVGIVQAVGDLGDYVELHSAVVGGATVSAVEPGTAPGDAFTLDAVFPNPFRERVTLTYTAARRMPVRIAVFDLLGREVALLLDGLSASPRGTLTWDAGDRPGGIYLVRVEAGERLHTLRLVRLR